MKTLNQGQPNSGPQNPKSQKVKNGSARTSTAGKSNPKTPFSGLTLLAGITLKTQWQEICNLPFSQIFKPVEALWDVVMNHPGLQAENTALGNIWQGLDIMHQAETNQQRAFVQWVHTAADTTTGGLPQLSSVLQGIADLAMHAPALKSQVEGIRQFCDGVTAMEQSKVLRFIANAQPQQP